VRATGLMTAARRGHRLPYPSLGRLETRAVETALRVAWARVRASKPATLRNANEVQITAELQRELNDLLNYPDPAACGFSHVLFETVTVGGEVCDYSGTKLQKKPDLVFRPCGQLQGDRAQYGLFAECKIIDDGHPVADYCTHGLLRFVNGFYAWAMSSGLMVAYVRNGATPPHLLQAYLDQHRRPMQVRSRPALRPRRRGPDAIYDSVHWRLWHYRSSGAQAVDIQIGHMWLHCV
jgi:hypothetical protein